MKKIKNHKWNDVINKKISNGIFFYFCKVNIYNLKEYLNAKNELNI